MEQKNMWFGKIIHNNLSNQMEYKEKITFDKLLNMNSRDLSKSCFLRVFQKIQNLS